MYGLLVLAAWKVLVVLAVAPDLPPWANYGLLGAVLFSIISPSETFRLVPGWVHRDVRTERDALKAELSLMVEKVLTVSQAAIPALRESTTVVNQAVEEIRLIRQRRR